ncbi:hypothetical protein ACYZTM_27815 [Pseudomonas sp. MDT2-39-1]
MTTAQSPENTVLVLFAPRVLGATQSIEGAHIGVSLVIYDLVIDGEGATVQVDPALSGTVDPGDVMELWLDGEVTYLDYEIIVDVNAITTLRVPKGRLHPDRINKLFYTIRRGSQNIGTSDVLTALYNKIRPGLKDTRPETDGHSELVLLLPDAIKNGVGADFVSAQVCVSYPYCRAYDTITLKCNGEIMTYKVGADEAPQPPNPGSADPITVCFTVTRAYLESAVRPGGKLDFSYTVTDQLGNTPDTDAVWSASETVDEDLAGTQLPAALLREQLNDPGDDLSVIDLEKLRGNPLLLIILTTDARFQVGYTVNALYIAALSGRPDVTVRVSGTVEADEFGQKKICVLEVPNDKVEAGRTVTVTYELFDGTTLVGRSRTATARVVGEATIELERPTIQQAPNNTSLDPLAAQQALTAIIPPAGLLPTDLLSVTWTGAPGTPDEGSHTTVPQPISLIGLIIALPTSLIAFSLGKTITVFFTITRGNAPAQPSKPLTLNVLPLVLGDAYRPKLKQAANNGEGPELHLKDLTAAGLMWFSDWPFIALGQYVWLTLSGTKANGDSYHQVIWAAPFAFTNQGWIDNGFFEALAPYAELMELKDGSTLTVEFKAALGRSQDEAQALAFPIRTYTVKALIEVRPEITSVKDPQSVEIPNGETTIHTSVTLSGTASAGQKVEIFDGPTTKGIADVGSNGIWTHSVTGLSVASHSFTAKALYGSGLVSTPPRTLTVTTEMILDPTPMVLNGFNISIAGTGLDWTLTGNDPADTAATRVPTGGTPPYSFQSSNPLIASVDRITGRVRSEGTGTATIYVSDQTQTKSFPVTTANVSRVIHIDTPINHTQYTQWVTDNNATIPRYKDNTYSNLIMAKYRPHTNGAIRCSRPNSYHPPTSSRILYCRGSGNTEWQRFDARPNEIFPGIAFLER